jgi:hypothetical protein
MVQCSPEVGKPTENGGTYGMKDHRERTFNNRALVRDLEEVCRRVNTSGATLPGGRRLVVSIGERLGCQHDGPLAQTG